MMHHTVGIIYLGILIRIVWVLDFHFTVSIDTIVFSARKSAGVWNTPHEYKYMEQHKVQPHFVAVVGFAGFAFLVICFLLFFGLCVS
jgi:hypothetical protein